MKPAVDVAWVAENDIVYLARLPSGPILILDGTAALIWSELVDPHAQDPLVERVRRHVTDPPPGLAAEVHAFVAQLQAERWIVDQAADPR